MHMFYNIQASVSLSDPRAPAHHDFGEAAGSTLARTLIKVSTSDDYTPESDWNRVGVF